MQTVGMAKLWRAQFESDGHFCFAPLLYLACVQLQLHRTSVMELWPSFSSYEAESCGGKSVLKKKKIYSRRKLNWNRGSELL